MSGSSTQFLLKKVKLYTERDLESNALLDGVSNFVDLQKMTVEVNLFESLDKSYLSAKLVIMDDIGWNPENVKLQGSEKIELEITGNSEDGLEGEVISIKDLRVVSILQQERTNDKTVVYVINCVSDYAYEDAAVKLSRSYTGLGEDIVEKVLDDYLDVGVKRDDNYIQSGEKSVQGDIKVVLPYISPLETTEWLTERLTTVHGLPWFAYATIWDQAEEGRNTIRYGTLDTMLTRGLINAIDESRLFTYSQHVAGITGDGSWKSRRREIAGYEIVSSENTLNMISQGTIGSRLQSFDTYTTQKNTRRFEISKYLEKKVKPFLVGEEYADVYDADDLLKIQGEEDAPDQFDARYNNLITSYGTYEWNNSYHEMRDPTDLLAKWSKTASLSVLHKNTVDVSLSGYNFLTEKITVGDVIRITFHKQIFGEEEESEEGLDEKLSGHYMILRLRHIMRGQRYDVAATVTKVATLENLA